MAPTLKPDLASVAIIGVGNMGGGMATNLLARGYTVHVHDVDPSKHDYCKQKGAVAQWNIAQAAIIASPIYKFVLKLKG
jgi:3-hydroxyisobutyrate dehydrogenase-like beta-hydroxyacid dehydrogenase